MTLYPSGQGDGLEIHCALPAGVRIPSPSALLNSKGHIYNCSLVASIWHLGKPWLSPWAFATCEANSRHVAPVIVVAAFAPMAKTAST